MKIPHKGIPQSSVADSIAATYPKSVRKTVHNTVTNLLAEMQRDGISDPRQQADVLAQAAIETSMGTSMTEETPGNYEHRTDLGNTQKGDGHRYIGRGYIQITGRASYAYWSHRLGVDLIKHPELAARPDIAAKIAVQGMRDGTFTGMTSQGTLISGGGKKLSDFINKTKTDFLHSREIVNSLDRAKTLQQKATEFLAQLSKPR